MKTAAPAAPAHNHPSESGGARVSATGRVAGSPNAGALTGNPPFKPCMICGEPSITLAGTNGTQRCDRCWELERRIECDPDLARKIIARIDRGEVRP